MQKDSIVSQINEFKKTGKYDSSAWNGERICSRCGEEYVETIKVEKQYEKLCHDCVRELREWKLEEKYEDM